MFAGDRRHDTGREVLDEVFAEEDEVLESTADDSSS